MNVQARYPIDASKPIETVEELVNHLCQAAALELSTIPLYLYSAYSIKTSSYSQWNPGISAFRAIRSVVIEEMLHLCLARNIVVAIGAGSQLRFYDEDLVPTYPSPMLHRVPTLPLSLERCTPAQMRETFMPLELPEPAQAPPQSESYNTIGQFYAAIREGLQRLSSPALWAQPQTELQYTSAYWNQDGGGSPHAVSDLKSAEAAIATIVEQGEGSAPGDDEVPLEPAEPKLGLSELSHYARFERIAEEIDQIGETWLVQTNPTPEELSGPVAQLAQLFDAAYCYVLSMIDSLYETSSDTVEVGKCSERYGLERTFIAAMGGLLYPIAQLLVEQPSIDGRNAAPMFLFYEFDPQQPKLTQLASLCDAVLGDFPSLGGDDGVRRLIGSLPAI